MKATVLREAGYEEALMGMAYSYKDRAIPVDEWWTEAQYNKADKRAMILAGKGGGHDKFLESIQVWLDVEASRAFWSEFDTYRVGMTKQSESTMHTLSKRPPEYYDFEEGTPPQVVQCFRDMWEIYKNDIVTLKHCLPEGFLQRRMVCTNYKVLQNIMTQRLHHRYKLWDVFINEVLEGLEHPEFLVKGMM